MVDWCPLPASGFGCLRAPTEPWGGARPPAHTPPGRTVLLIRGLPLCHSFIRCILSPLGGSSWEGGQFGDRRHLGEVREPQRK